MIQWLGLSSSTAVGLVWSLVGELKPCKPCGMAKKESLTFRGVLFNLQVLWDFPAVLLLLTFSLIPLWAESRHCIIPIILNLFRCILWARMWPILVVFYVSWWQMCVLSFWIKYSMNVSQISCWLTVHLFEFLIFLDIYPGVELLDHMVLFLVF